MMSEPPHRPFCSLIAALTMAIGLTSTAYATPTPYEKPDSARVLRLASIEIAGNKRATDRIILGHIALEPGDVVTAGVLEDSRVQLLATDYFSEVDFSTRPGPERGTVVLRIDVEEKGFPSFETGFGYHDLYGWFLTLGGLRFDNLFGVESRLRVGVRLGWRLAGLDAEWVQWLSRDGRYSLGARAYVYGTDQRFWAPPAPAESQPAAGEAWREYQQKIDRRGADVALRVGHRRSALFSFGVRVEGIDPDSSFQDIRSDQEFGYEDLPSLLQTGLGGVTQTGIFMRVLRDSRNTPVYPSDGSLARFSLVSNNSWMGGDQIFTRTEADGRKYVHVRDGWVLAGRLAGGLVTSGTPYYDRFYIGGIYSIRGFANWSLSNPGGDDGYWLANAEVRWPLAGGTPRRPRLVGLVFVDAGQGYRRDAPLRASDISVGAGYGARVRLPWLGTLGLDFGVPLTDDKTRDPFVVYGSMGFSF
jgi:outer membrane protein assembly factor BamA